jgi:hypothetical protein
MGWLEEMDIKLCDMLQLPLLFIFLSFVIVSLLSASFSIITTFLISTTPFPLTHIPLLILFPRLIFSLIRAKVTIIAIIVIWYLIYPPFTLDVLRTGYCCSLTGWRVGL